ncbi:hypothetical protein [Methanococcus aeolicus]|uniref:Uncharacterized protein n=1 Tax=Methanococcus aeolicus (strain ATCC BAA-1280 / DSM 17508 / OCM 812 / Nankai-3) TaxID=419665 RepID=A6UTR4_META3|nr:hypothetical protein [Methanococcus aeolicus]ABR55886.1 hypothetical protein Maeo_0298 [Methanococcus aeolicus Nankai-3]UXM84009.1 hypothetical protein N6C89_04365 [Methanococcus aeolicus]
MDEIDAIAINMLINAPLMSEKEMKYATNRLKIMAKKKILNKRAKRFLNNKNRLGGFHLTNEINNILDYWADEAYIISMKL